MIAALFSLWLNVIGSMLSQGTHIKTGEFRLVSASMLGHGPNLQMTFFSMMAMGGSAGNRNS